MAPTTTKTKRAAPAPTKAPARKIAAKKAPAAPAPPPRATLNGDSEEPLIRVAFSAEDLTKLVDHLDGWSDSIAYRLKMRLAKHQERWG
jgi:hypothetical protein